jgi:hypothetical protein
VAQAATVSLRVADRKGLAPHGLTDSEVQAGWNGRFITWERDGHLHPGHYVWRVAIHDDQGKVYSAVEQKVNIENPRGAAIMASSLIIGNSCWKSVSAADGMRQRSEVSAKDEEQVHFAIDPMKAGDCRVRPVSPERLTSADLLRTFVRLYPAEKLRKKDAAESWAAVFVLRSETGAVEARRETKFVADGGSGYLAFVEMPLGGDGVQAGPHTLEVEMRGPGIHGALKQSRQISIAPLAHQVSMTAFGEGLRSERVHKASAACGAFQARKTGHRRASRAGWWRPSPPELPGRRLQTSP